MIKYVTEHGITHVIVNQVSIGEIFAKDDGFYDFWPILDKHGYWPGWLLLEIGNYLARLNEPLEQDLNKFFEENRND